MGLTREFASSQTDGASRRDSLIFIVCSEPVAVAIVIVMCLLTGL